MLKLAIPALAALLLAAPAATAADPTGTWTMGSGKITVRVGDCGGKLCGKIVALKKPLDKSGNPKVDKENPNPSLRSRRLIGISLLSDMKPAGDNAWQGYIYNPDDGHTYTAKMKLVGNVMSVKGCVAGVLCKTKKFFKVN